MTTQNLQMPGNPRYQPKSLLSFFGYDNLMRPVGRVELANLDVLAELGIIPHEEYALLTPAHREVVLNILTTEVDRVEREVTQHDILAWKAIAQTKLPQQLSRWIHAFLTSYDTIDTASILRFKEAHHGVLVPHVKDVIHHFVTLVRRYAHVPQIGRTHGQHAVPITVGFWLASILDRLVNRVERMKEAEKLLVGKISGPVGAHNAEVALGITALCGERSYEERVLERLGLQAAPISTQILSPEPLIDYLFACVGLSRVLAQFGRDGRSLMRSEIGEVGEEFVAGQGGSSTMAHKRNPITFEGLEGAGEKCLAEFWKVMSLTISEHQRDLTGSSVMRDAPTIIVTLVHQLESLLRRKKGGSPFLLRIHVDEAACARNLGSSAGVMLAEPAYLALILGGYTGNAHEVVKSVTADRGVRIDDPHYLLWALKEYAVAKEDDSLCQALLFVEENFASVFAHPEQYVGNAERIALSIAEVAQAVAIEL